MTVMRALATVLACGLVVLTPDLPALAAPGTPPVAELTDFSCQRALDPPLRAVSVTAVVRPMAGTARMELRFDLLRARRPRGIYRPVHGPNLGRWFAPSDPALGRHAGDEWRVPHPVVGLSAPAYYRLRVTFRWLDQSGLGLGRRVLSTPLCHQVERRPDLRLSRLAIQAATGGQDTYLATVTNGGATGAGPFAVRLRLADGSTVSGPVGWLAARAATQVSLTAAACTTGSVVTVTADPAGTVDDFNPTNNTLSVSCPQLH